MKPQTFLWGMFLLALGCKQSIPDDVLPAHEMENVLFDIHIVDGYLNNLPHSDSLKTLVPAYYNGVYKKYGIDSGIIARSKNFYYQRTDLYKEIYTHITARLMKEKDRLDKLNKAKIAKQAKLDSIAKAKIKADSLMIKKADSVRKIKADSLAAKKKTDRKKTDRKKTDRKKIKAKPKKRKKLILKPSH